MDTTYTFIPCVLFGTLWGLFHTAIWISLYQLYTWIPKRLESQISPSFKSLCLIAPTIITLPLDYLALKFNFTPNPPSFEFITGFQTWGIVVGLWLYLFIVVYTIEK